MIANYSSFIFIQCCWNYLYFIRNHLSFKM